jgi:hypothetical protein
MKMNNPTCDRCFQPIIECAFVMEGHVNGFTRFYHKTCPPVIDYKKILLAYMKTVGETEGVDFVDPMTELTDEENAVFLELAAEGCVDWQKERRLKLAAQFRRAAAEKC